MSYKLYVKHIDKETYIREEQELFRLLPIWRREKAERLTHLESRMQSVMAGLLLEEGLKDYTGDSSSINEKNYDVEKRCCYIGDSEAVHFSITHSGEYVAVALSDKPVGVDIEHKEDRNFRVTRRMLAAEDIAYIGESQERFREVWTIKESYLKCLGVGITVPLSSFTVAYSRVRLLENGRRLYEVLDDSISERYVVETGSLEESPDYSVAICYYSQSI